jgi:hypothetical protein
MFYTRNYATCRFHRVPAVGGAPVTVEGRNPIMYGEALRCYGAHLLRSSTAG